VIWVYNVYNRELQKTFMVREETSDDYKPNDKCGGCGAPILNGTGRETVFCSDSCRTAKRNAYARSKYREKRAVEPTERNCAVCGKAFVAKRSDARFCGPTCRQRASRAERVPLEENAS
jgi:predicted nucleic acid-binding Zn ribbon protein